MCKACDEARRVMSVVWRKLRKRKSARDSVVKNVMLEADSSPSRYSSGDSFMEEQVRRCLKPYMER